MKMYSKFFAVLINCIFAICLNYTLLALIFIYKSNFVTEADFVIGFSLYNIVWLLVDVRYNRSRYKKQGAGLFFWMSIILPVIIIMFLIKMIILVS